MYLKTFEDMEKTSVFFLLKPVNSVYGFIITICVSIITFIIWALFAQMDDVIKANVLLRPSSAVSTVKCVTSGQVYLKNFENDDLVQEGDFLFALDTTANMLELETYKEELKKNANDIYVNSVLSDTIKNGVLPDILKNSDAYVKANIYLTEYNRYETSISDIENKLEREKNKPDSMIVPQNIVDLENQLNQNILLFENWKNSQKMNTIETKKTLQTQKNTIESHISELERFIKNSTIYAPISGRIAENTKINIGDYILAGEEILRIVPQNDKNIKADIYVDPSYIARVKIGNPVKIKFPGLPPSRYGMIETNVSIIPPDVNYNNGVPIFIVEADINTPYLSTKNGQTAHLIPGITAEGRIVTDRSTVMQMVLRKLDFIN